MRRTGDLKLIQELNRSIVLDTIRQYGPISRVEISKKLNISPTTVTSAVNELIHEGLVREDGIGASSGGRKPILLRFDPNCYTLIGVSIRYSTITIAEMNLEAQILRKEIFSTHSLYGEAVADFIIEKLKCFLNSDDSYKKCIGISVITQGLVDYDKGVIRYNPKLKMQNVPLKKILKTQFDLPTWLDNDTNAYILAEKYFGAHQNIQNMIYIEIGEGVGAGIFVNGTIFRGASGSAGEFGHTTIDRGGMKCDCGNNGCLENYVSWPAIYSRILTFLSNGKDSVIKEMVDGDITKIAPDVFVKAVNLGDHLALKILDEIVHYLASGIINLIHLFNPEAIILGGEIILNNAILLSKINEYVSKHALEAPLEDVTIKSTSLGQEFEMVGAASVILQEKFQFTLN